MRSLLGFIFMLGTVLGLTVLAAYSIQNNGLPDIISQYLPATQEETGPKPEDTLQAPFADEGLARYKHETRKAIQAGKDVEDKTLDQLFKPTDGAGIDNNLKLPHRSKEEVSEWLIKAISEVLSVNPAKYDEHKELLKTGMDLYAMNDFETFMQKSNILAVLKQNKLKLHSYVEEAPILLNAGAVDGRYRWKFEMPVTLSFLPHDVDDYRTLANSRIPNQYINLKVQVGRASSVGTEGIVIETLDFRKNTEKGAQ